MITIAILGDSVGEGFYDSENGGWVELLRRHYHVPNPDMNIYNLSISGDNTRKLLKRIYIELGARDVDVLLLSLGINDSYCRDGDIAQANVALEEFEQNLETFYADFSSYKIIITGLFSVDESKTRPVSWKNIHYTNSRIALYNQKLEELAKKYALPFIDMSSVLSPEDIADGVHPNTQGHRKLFEKIEKELKRYLKY